MATKTSAGLLMYKFNDNKLKVFLVHPGGPFWKNKDNGSWSIPKGEIDDDNLSKENIFENAKRELKEETGIEAPKEDDKYVYLDTVRQKSGKIVHAWAFQGDWIGLLMCHSYVEIEYPYKSGKIIKIPEVDKADFFSIEKAKEKINPAQREFINRLENYLKEKIK